MPAASKRKLKTKPKPDVVDIRVGQNLRIIRTMRGISQQALGQADEISFQQVQKYERGSNRMSASRLYEFSKILDVNITDFFQGLDKKDPQHALMNTLSTLEKEDLEMLLLFQKISDKDARKSLIKILKNM